MKRIEFWKPDGGFDPALASPEKLADAIIAASPPMPNAELHRHWLLGLSPEALWDRLQIIQEDARPAPTNRTRGWRTQQFKPKEGVSA